MKFEDILALAKQGYTPKDIKELLEIELPKDEPPKDEQPKDEPPKDEPPKDEPPKDEPTKDGLDYKKLYEESQDALKKAQQDNLKKDASGSKDEKTDSEILKDFAQSFM